MARYTDWNEYEWEKKNSLKKMPQRHQSRLIGSKL